MPRPAAPAPAAPVCALLLTAGRSRRMGTPKAWLRLDGESLVLRIARNAVAGGAHRLVVVVGRDATRRDDGPGPAARCAGSPAAAGRVRPIGEAPDARPAPRPSRRHGARSPHDSGTVSVGQLDASRLVSRAEVDGELASLAGAGADILTVVGCPDGQPIDSLRAGLSLVPEGDSLLLWPVDYPFAGAALVERLVRALGDRPDHVCIPTVSGRSAHPVLLGRRVALELATRAADDGARAVVQANPARIIRVESEDARLLLEINTPAQAAACGLSGSRERALPGLTGPDRA